MSVRQILAGLLFMVVVVARDRARLVKLWTTPADRKQLLLFTAFGLLFNQFCYLSAVRLTNAGTGRRSFSACSSLSSWATPA